MVVTPKSALQDKTLPLSIQFLQLLWFLSLWGGDVKECRTVVRPIPGLLWKVQVHVDSAHLSHWSRFILAHCWLPSPQPQPRLGFGTFLSMLTHPHQTLNSVRPENAPSVTLNCRQSCYAPHKGIQEGEIALKILGLPGA